MKREDSANRVCAEPEAGRAPGALQPVFCIEAQGTWWSPCLAGEHIEAQGCHVPKVGGHTVTGQGSEVRWVWAGVPPPASSLLCMSISVRLGMALSVL